MAQKALGLLGMAARKSFLCDIRSVRVTNIERRRRDVQIIFSLGVAIDSEQHAAREGVRGRHNDLHMAGREAGGVADRKQRKRSFWPRALMKPASPALAAKTSRPILFTTDIAEKLERGKTAHLKKRFTCKWKARKQPFASHACPFQATTGLFIRSTWLAFARTGSLRRAEHTRSLYTPGGTFPIWQPN